MVPEVGAPVRDCWAVAFGDAQSVDSRVVAAGYDNGDVKVLDLVKGKIRWETNVANGVCGLEVRLKRQNTDQKDKHGSKRQNTDRRAQKDKDRSKRQKHRQKGGREKASERKRARESERRKRAQKARAESARRKRAHAFLCLGREVWTKGERTKKSQFTLFSFFAHVPLAMLEARVTCA